MNPYTRSHLSDRSLLDGLASRLRQQRAIESIRHVPGGELMPQQLLRVAQLIVRALAHGELEAEALYRKRSHPRSL